MSEQFESFEEFWPHYVREHAAKTNRMLHFLGTGAAVTSLAAAGLKRDARLALLAPLLGYGAAWVGHFFVENNRPATFQYPLWSLRGDLRMFGKMLTGRMDEEVERAVAEERERVRRTNGESHGRVVDIDGAGAS